MARLAAEQIIERIANANGAQPAAMRQQIEQALQNIIALPNPIHLCLRSCFLTGIRLWMNWW